ncbi:NTP transferase domain-containing protein [Candidatus Puniceispirillum marinum]|uniref:Nucleotidyl transferase n=1 Tax=Puniceispirillum marinum (strain IMCC1322) TaxID=488538 RepID=D5BSH1_PUNMI|nr:NTP transferase domain-containing protein [Candidatus Puniceispirillum marinum]ADE39218.1 Nucleotidyl transferase [Candidatus Puniceispirillum marinum IMCC1322]
MYLLILCGGKASRLQGVNNDVPKCLLKAQGTSILGTLINELSDYCAKVIISHADGKPYYNDILSGEITGSKLEKITLVQDQFQKGTAHAVQLHTCGLDGDFCVMNGDTLFSNYDALLPKANANYDVCFSTSFQSIGRATQIFPDTKAGGFDFKKDDMGKDDTKGHVTNGVIYLGGNAVRWLQDQTLEKEKSIEGVLLSNAHKCGLSFGMHQSGAEFIDFGTPAEYLNPNDYLLSFDKIKDE